MTEASSSKKVLITGGSGLLGNAITELLLQKGYQVLHVGRKASTGKVKCYRWSIEENHLDPKALEGVDVVIHLAGAGVADKRWTAERKKVILESRTKSSTLLLESLKNIPNEVKTVISATAIGYYGLTTHDNWCTEEDKAGNDFLASVTKQWEESIDPIASLNIRLVKMRIGVVLSNKGGALIEMSRPVKWFVGAPLASGKQWVSWIHIDDLANMFLHAIEHKNLSGVFNAVAPNPVTNKEINSIIAKALNRPNFLPAVPEFILKIILGEMTQIVVNGARVSCDKIKNSDYQFKFTDASKAVHDLLK